MSNETNLEIHVPDRKARRAAGKSLRDVAPRSSQAIWNAPADRPDIVSLIEETNQGRLAQLIPMRYARMVQSPLAYLRGSAVVMARDLAGLPTTNIRLQSCGDCHLQNFGWFASPERNLIFDVNDFDETRQAPWEWDLKRLVASVVVAARAKQASKSEQRDLAKAVVSEYRTHLADYAELGPLEMWYVKLDATALLHHASSIASKKRCQQIIDAASQKTVDRLLPKLTETVDGVLRFKESRPLIFHPMEYEPYYRRIRELMTQYRRTLSEDRQALLDRYRVVDIAYKVVGVGSVGLRCGIILMLDPDNSPLILQIKEARASVLEPYVGHSQRPHHGHRIVHGQRLMQAASDIFLGWATDGEGRSYYVRQLRDMKISIDVDAMSLSELEEYVRLCGWGLARAHAKAGDAAAQTGYIGSSDQFDEALSDFGWAYANQVELDHQTLVNAAKSGRISTEVFVT